MGTTWYANDGTRSAVPPSEASVDSSGNIVGENVGCYGVNLAQPSYVLMLSSPCVDASVIGTRQDGTQLTTDINGTTRDNGAPDIGCYEYR